MLRKLPLIFTFLVVVFHVKAQEPTTVHLSAQGKVLEYNYDFSAETKLLPLTNLTLNGKGEVQEILLQIEGTILRLNAYGKPVRTIQGPFKVEWNNAHQIEKIKQGYETIFRFYYDLDGRLEKVKNDEYDVCFALRYNFDGGLNKIDYGDYDYYAVFSYTLNNQLEYIKDGDYNYIWKIYYGANQKIEKIKDGNYEVRVEMEYTNYELTSISKYNTATSFILPYQHQNDYDDCQHNPSNGQVTFFSENGFNGDAFTFGLGDYSYLPSDWNNQISSAIIPNGICVMLYEHSNFSGKSLLLTANWSVAYWSDYWNNRASSIRIFYQ